MYQQKFWKDNVSIDQDLVQSEEMSHHKSPGGNKPN